jgi:dienelactone hydrolase
MFFIISCLLATALFTQPDLLITQPSGKTIDQQVHIQVEKLKPFQKIELCAEAKDEKGNIWCSHASFSADSQGRVDLFSNSPNNNSSYEGVDPMGLFWSMLPVSGDTCSSFKCKNDKIIVEIKLYVRNELVKKQTVSCYLKSPDVQRIDVRENGLVGVLFLPPSKHPPAVIITLSGSNGGLSENRAKLLASNGFAVLALGYFGVDCLPSNLQEIPLEYFETAFAWLKKQPNIDSSHIGLYGVSRGAELSLILGSFFPSSVQAIVAIVPSSVVYGGLRETPVNAWIYEGKPILPFATVSQTDFADGRGKTRENPANTRQSFLEGMKDKGAFAAAAIAVENICCPILLISGGDDQMWPSDLYVQQIIDRLEKKHSSIVCRYLHYPRAGHGINIPNLPIAEPVYYHPISNLWFSMGGTRSADAKASSDSWNKLIAFFHESLDSKKIR